jgi:mannose-1-phosphate guanylyltransferase
MIMAKDPRAVVHIFPADHYVFPEERFWRIARASALLASCRPDRMVLMGAQPDGPEVDYGWVKASSPHGIRSRVLGVEAFFEKPPKQTAERLFREGGYWNTMIIAAKARLIWEVARELFPQMMERFEEVRQMFAASLAHRIRPTALRKAVDRVYDGIVAADLSRHILQKVPERLLLLAMDQIDWSDWGRPGRIENTLRRLGKEPHFADHSHGVGVPLMST